MEKAFNISRVSILVRLLKLRFGIKTALNDHWSAFGVMNEYLLVLQMFL